MRNFKYRMRNLKVYKCYYKSLKYFRSLQIDVKLTQNSVIIAIQKEELMSMQLWRMCKIFIVVCILMLVVMNKSYTDKARRTWLPLEKDIELSTEGFRGVMWCTPLDDIPWKMNRTFTHTRMLRDNEDYNIFGVTAHYITYTMRNTILYGVRIDISGKTHVDRAYNAIKHEYPPVGDIVQVDDKQLRWSTNHTRVWITMPEDDKDFGQIFIWGRDRKFPDDSVTPVYLHKPIPLLSTGKKYKPRHYVIYRTSSPITIDGHITEKAWQDAQWTEPFEDSQSPYCVLPWKMTRAKILYDDENIFFAAHLQEENVWGRLTKRDTISYYDNDFEIFIDPTADAVNYFEYEFTCLNQAFDMWHENDNNRNARADGRYDAPGMRHAVQVQGTLNYHHDIDDGWILEVMIPFTDMMTHNQNMTVPKRGDMWRINFSRVQYMHIYNQLFPYLLPYSPVEDWVWQATLAGSLHITEMWGKGLFSDRYAGPVTDKELEQAYPILKPPKPPKRRRRGMVHFPACSMTLGPDQTDPVHSPAHSVEVPEFLMDRYEVTIREYCDFLNMGGNDQWYNERMAIHELCGIVKDGPGSYHVIPGREDYPVVFVDHDAAMAYAQSKGMTLPTEAMWERAAGGIEGRNYPWGNEPIDPSRANYDFCYGGTLPVGSFPKGATPEGVYDLCGNVKEWTDSKFNTYPGGADYEHFFNPPFWTPPYPERSLKWVNRGGGWTTQEKCMATGYRHGGGLQNVGFRCVKVSK